MYPNPYRRVVLFFLSLSRHVLSMCKVHSKGGQIQGRYVPTWLQMFENCTSTAPPTFTKLISSINAFYLKGLGTKIMELQEAQIVKSESNLKLCLEFAHTSLNLHNCVWLSAYMGEVGPIPQLELSSSRRQKYHRSMYNRYYPILTSQRSGLVRLDAYLKMWYGSELD